MDDIGQISISMFCLKFSWEGTELSGKVYIKIQTIS